ncbi:protein-disulfide reductase DsbD domain-containing protein [Rhizobium sp. Rhizsp42]|uniref:protein-disulfide reductase DsbD domain-containing protein n=1 Tax=Rhizobium sp. Rhizsp42 TaxID=3243034 RepID=UPI0039AE964C
MTFAPHKIHLILIIATALGLSLPVLSAAQAGTSEWVDNAGGRMRLVAMAPDAHGKIRAGLQIEPNAGWITYWREPGNSGIPPQITIAPETGVTLDKIGYPIPKHIKDDRLDDIGYDAPVTLPLTLSATSGATEIKAQAFIGICKDICVPFQADLTVALSAAGQSQPEEKAILDAADARLPEAPSSKFKVTKHTLSADQKELTLDITLPDIGDTTPDVAVAGPSGYVFTKQLMSKRDGASLTTTIAIGKLPKNYDISGKSWSALVIDGARAIESPLAFK